MSNMIVKLFKDHYLLQLEVHLNIRENLEVLLTHCMQQSTGLVKLALTDVL
ncbi:hypothetical protein D3C85_1675370 [compost metagenome]